MSISAKNYRRHNILATVDKMVFNYVIHMLRMLSEYKCSGMFDKALHFYTYYNNAPLMEMF